MNNTQQVQLNTKTQKRKPHKGLWKKGQSGNPGGRPSFASIKNLTDALENYGRGKNGDFWKMVAKKAYTNPQILIAILKKLLPDKVHAEGLMGTKIVIVRSSEKEKNASDTGRFESSTQELSRSLPI